VLLKIAQIVRIVPSENVLGRHDCPSPTSYLMLYFDGSILSLWMEGYWHLPSSSFM